jgi:hypothetical protein
MCFKGNLRKDSSYRPLVYNEFQGKYCGYWHKGQYTVHGKEENICPNI